MKELIIVISETGQSVFVHESKTKKCLKLFSVCDYKDLDETVQAARDFKRKKLHENTSN